MADKKSRASSAGNKSVGGRPTDYTDDLGDIICEQIACGKSLSKICQAENMPNPSTVYRWIRKHPAFCKNYELAKEDQADMMVEEMLEIADDSSADYIADDNGIERVNSEAIARSRLRVDTRKWAASKFKAKKYGDRLSTDNVNHNIEYAELSDDELDAKLRLLEKRA